MKVDFSKGVALHRMYGHYTFVKEAQKAGKNGTFMMNVCTELRCFGKSQDWRNNLNTDNIERISNG